MRGHEDEAAIYADAYIDELLAAHGGGPVLVPQPDGLLSDPVRRAIELLEAGLPRFHPSFRFEEGLAARLRLAATAGRGAALDSDAEIIPLPVPASLGGLPAGGMIDRRILVGGAIASGVSLAGAAMLVRAHQRRGRGRSRIEWLS